MLAKYINLYLASKKNISIMKTSHEFFVEFQKQLQLCNDAELISKFNVEVGNRGSGAARFAFLAALHHEFIRRGFDYSEIGDTKSISFKHQVILENKVIKKL
jgi:hypothetical protein